MYFKAVSRVAVFSWVSWRQQPLQFAQSELESASGGHGGWSCYCLEKPEAQKGELDCEQLPQPQGLHPALFAGTTPPNGSESCACHCLSARCAGNLSYYTKIVVIPHTPGTYILFLMTSLSSL